MRDSTYAAGVPVGPHSWFRLTPSYGPGLVRTMLGELGARPGSVILDPFAGGGTTLIESRLAGMHTLGCEINPFLHFAVSTSLTWDVDGHDVSTAIGCVADNFLSLRSRFGDQRLDQLPEPMPPIHNPLRWWREDVLRDLLLLRRAIDSIADSSVRGLLRLALAGVLVPDLTNVTLGRLQLHFIDRSKAEIDVLGTWSRHAETISKDLLKLRKRVYPPTVLKALDSTTLTKDTFADRATHVLTSPPYPNRYSYVWNTRPHLYLFGFIGTGREASDLDKRTIGGTWGTATSVLNKGIVAPAHDAIADCIVPVASRIRAEDNLMANYLMKYFNDLAKHLIALTSVLERGARIAYVVGCSRLKGVYVETDELLARVLDRLDVGYRVESIVRFRKRHSGKDLHESIVYAGWRP